MGRDILARILRELGAEVVQAGRAETFVPIDTENITEEMLDRLDGLVARRAGVHFDAVVSTDGDSDRPLVAAVLPPGETDARGRHVRFLPGDLLGIVVAEYLRADAVAVPISANDAVERRMGERGSSSARRGSARPMSSSPSTSCAARRGQARVVGWEANGGFLLGSGVALAGDVLEALPTRDATLPILANLFAAAEQHVGLSALWSRLPARFGRAGLIDRVPVAVSSAILARLVPAGDTTEVEFDAAGQVLERGRPDGKLTPLAAPDGRRVAGTQGDPGAIVHARLRLRRHRAHQRP